MTPASLTALLHYLLREMTARSIIRLEALVSVPHPYPEVAGCEESFVFTLQDDGTITRDGTPVTGVTARLKLLEKATRYRVRREVHYRDGRVLIRAA